MTVLKLSIKLRLLFLAVTSILGLVVIGGVVVSSVAEIERIDRAAILLGDLKPNMLKLRRHEKDFLARKDDKYVEKFNGVATKNAEQLKQFELLLQESGLEVENIRQTISEFQAGANHVVSTVASSEQRAESGIERVTRSSEILNDLSQMASAINDMNMQIAAAAQEQGATAEEISRNVTRVSDLSQGVKSQTDQTSQASQELAEMGASLREMVKAFKV